MIRHLARLNAPKSWSLRKRKGIRFIVNPNAGPHKIEKCIPLSLVLKDLLKYAKTTREVKKILNDGKILVDKKIRKDIKFPVGVMDIIEIPSTNEYFRIGLNNKNKFTLIPIKKEDSNFKFYKITSKTILKGNKTQLNLYDGNNILVEKDGFKVGDSLILDLNKKSIKKHLKFDKGAVVYVYDGKYVGEMGKVEDIKKMAKMSIVKVKTKNRSIGTLKRYVFVVDESFKNEAD